MSDLVSRALDKIATTLMIDDEWMVRSERELTWTGHRLGQTFSVKGPYENNGVHVCRVSSTVPVVVSPQAENLDGILGLENWLAVADSLVWHPTEGLVTSHVAAVFHEETFDWRLSQFISLAIIQLVFLEARAEALSDSLRGHPAYWVHPQSGQREIPDDMLNVVAAIFQPAGQEPSRFMSADDFHAVESWLDGTPFYSMGGSQEGISIEVPFGTDDTSLIRLRSDQMHPQLGSGLLVTLQIRLQGEAGKRTLAGIAADLNWRECEAAGMHQYGAWHVRERDDMLTHVHFLPNVEYRQGVTVSAAQGQIMRAMWADQLLNASGALELRDAAAIVYDRLLDSDPSPEPFEA